MNKKDRDSIENSLDLNAYTITEESMNSITNLIMETVQILLEQK